mgnify:CR=1 FL=1
MSRNAKISVALVAVLTLGAVGLSLSTSGGDEPTAAENAAR